MKILSALSVLYLLFISQVFAVEKGSNQEILKALDASWEKAQLDLNLEHLQSLLAEDFIWVHNHAGTIDTKSDVLARIERYLRSEKRDTRARINKNVEVIVLGETGVVSGYTTVDRGPIPVTYHFMRTYVKTNGKYSLLANHTMAIPTPNSD